MIATLEKEIARLEEEKRQTYAREEQTRSESKLATEYNRHISDNYQKLFGNGEARVEMPTVTTVTTDNARRIADYHAVAPAKDKKDLFSGVIYRNGQLVNTMEREETHEESVAVAAAPEMHVSYDLTPRAKAFLIAVVAAVALILAVICINSAIISSLSGEINVLQVASNELKAESVALAAQIKETTSPEAIAAFAQKIGMIAPMSL